MTCEISSLRAFTLLSISSSAASDSSLGDFDGSDLSIGDVATFCFGTSTPELLTSWCILPKRSSRASSMGSSMESLSISSGVFSSPLACNNSTKRCWTKPVSSWPSPPFERSLQLFVETSTAHVSARTVTNNIGERMENVSPEQNNRSMLA